jgi:hypothetical protein
MVKPPSGSSEPGASIERRSLDVDRGLLRRNLGLSHEQRLLQLQELARFADELRRAGREAGLRGKM